MNNGEFICKFLKSIETPDDNTVVFVWNDPQPSNKVKDYLIAQATQGQIPYHIYGKYVDKAAQLLKQAIDKQADTPDKRGAFGIDFNKAQDIRNALDKNWQDFLKENPKYPIATGPYKVVNVTASDMILEKRPDYWNADKITFDKVYAKQVPDPSGQYAMLKAGQLDRFDGTQARDILESILAANKDLLHYRMFDPASMGFVFNIQKPPFNDVKFRRALIYTFDKKKIREVGNYYGKESIGYSVMGMPESFVDQWVLPEVKDKMTKFSYDPAKAEELLKEIGWSKGSDGIWRDKNGKQYNFVIGANAGWAPNANAAEICAEQLTKFGMPTKLRAVD
ncbi:extracellular solute-binding protein, family 5 Middle [Caldanaerobius fijiensis DSM 17918]|uniref:Extracellular solute-binding protein, family 5 Middle n=1 Tax=Caldanaerobius fijiensis DSM 17918 TaxID=1121256 RepID=A0A1M5AYJ7_9THEO|nr:extracellular solute-binding protein, family 5 Middle [Caldanaerobius fijiensis DSM 17918]